MSRRMILLVAALLGLTLVPLGAPSSADASCVGPKISTHRDDRRPDDVLVLPRTITMIRGEWFHSGCEDTNQPGCSATSTEEPIRDLVLTLQQGQRHWVLDTADAGDRDSHFAVTWHVQIPAGAHAGRAVLVAKAAEEGSTRQVRIEAS